jgi:uncharacterized membrane protein YozB (DUF420 family)
VETIARRTGWVIMYLLIILLVLASSRYFAPGMPDAFQPEVYLDYSVVLRVHIGAGIVAVLVGPFQFWSGFRDRHRVWHKRMGATYLTAVGFAAAGGLVMATVSYGGLVTHIGFGLLAITWSGTAAVAYVRIRAGNWPSHREWMIRSFSIALAFVMLRVWMGILGALGADELELYQTASWLCWVPNIIVAEFYIGWYRNRQAAPTAAPAE